MKMSEMEDEGHNSDVILNVAVISNNLNKLYFYEFKRKIFIFKTKLKYSLKKFFISTLSTIRFHQNRKNQYIYLI